MAKFLTTAWVSSHIEDIIKRAKKTVVLVSPYLQFSQNFYQRLKDAESHKVDITIIYGKSELNAKESELLSNLKKLNLFYSENLHAKCYFNESEMVITSMNMYEYSEKNNREMGVFISKQEDPEIFEDASRETLSILNSAVQVNLKKTVVKKSKIPVEILRKLNGGVVSKNLPVSSGFCIRCAETIPFEPERPYCGTCYYTWSQFENPHYEEPTCHQCGYDNKSTIIKPVCYSCYKGKM